MKELICLVCGLRINADNFNNNRHGRITENSLQDIKCCPFCGVDKKYLGSENEPYYTRIKGINEETMKIIDHAMKLEVFNGSFYNKAASMAVDENLKKMFKDLSKIEFMHAAIHKKIGGFSVLPKLKEIDYSRLEKDEMLVESANKREQHAVSYYEKYLKKIEDNNIVLILEALSGVEKEHIEMTVQ
jgi:rubrerythrin